MDYVLAHVVNIFYKVFFKRKIGYMTIYQEAL